MSTRDSSADSPTTTLAEPRTPLSVPLPRRVPRNASDAVWNTYASHSEDDDNTPGTPLAHKCGRVNGVCCKELKGDDERTLIDPDVVRDIVIGLSDGLTVPFALTAGLSGIGNSRIVILGGFAELIAGAISMGIGGFLASQSERDHFRYLRKQTRDRVARSCDGEMMREVHGVLGPVGIDEGMSRSIAMQLRHVELDLHRAPKDAPSNKGWFGLGAKKCASQEDSVGEAGGLKWSEDVGLTAFLLKFGEGYEEVPTSRLYISAFTIGMGYFLGGLVPLLPYFFISPINAALIWSCIVTGIILLIFGAFKTHFTGGTGGVKGYLWGSVSMLVVGGTAAGAAFAIVKALEVGE